MNKRLLAVYGSLRLGFGNNRLLHNSNMLSIEVVNIPYRMISLGGFPGLVPSEENHNITVEVWEVDDNTYERIEYLEGYPSFYQKDTINTSVGDAEIYVLLDRRYQAGNPDVESGDWKEFYKRRYAEV